MKKKLQIKDKIHRLMKLSLIQICIAMIFASVCLAKNAEAQDLLSKGGINGKIVLTINDGN